MAWSFSLQPRLALACLACLAIQRSAPAQPAAQPPSAEGLPVRRVQFEGLEQVSETFCQRRVVTAVGQPFSQTVLGEDIRRLIRTEKFYDVQAASALDEGQVVVTFALQERPTVAAIEFQGNVKFSDKDLLKELDLQPGEPLNSFAVQQSVAYIEQRYRDAGYSAVRVVIDQEVMRQEQRLLFNIEEGPRIRLRDIAFEGNASFTERQLTALLSTRKYLPLIRTGDFNPDAAELDAATVQRHYRDRGFLDARVSYRTEPLEPSEDLRVVFVVEEGDLYTIAAIFLENNVALSDEDVESVMQLRPGGVMRQDVLGADLEAIERRYGEMGYLYATARASQSFTEIPGEVQLALEFTEGEPYTIGLIQLRGNQQTKDRVLRRELVFFPEELFDTSKLKRSEDDLRNVGLFRTARITPVGDEPQVRDVLVEVVESTQTTNFILGGGVGSNSGLAGSLSYEARNFDLFDWPRSWGEFFRGRAFHGAGQYFRAQLSPGTEVSSFRIDFREPYLAYKPIKLGTSFYLWQRGREDFDEQRLGTIISLGKPIEQGFLEGWAGELAFRLEDVKISDLEWIPARDIAETEGHNLLLSFQARLIRNRTDRRFSPTRGDVWTLSYEQAVGDYTFGKLEAGYRWYKTVTVDEQGRPSVFGVKAETGVIVDNAPVFERFYAGGLGSLRGFEFRGVTPRGGPFFDDDQRIGGEFKLLAGTEYSFPLVSKTLRGVLFTDMGTIEEDVEITDWRASVGIGLRIFIENYFGPVPLEFNLAAPLAKNSDDDTQVFSFAMGITF